MARRTTPRDVAFRAVGRADSPDVFGIAGVFAPQCQTEPFVRVGGGHGILPPVDLRRLALAPSPEIDPRM